MKVVRLGSLFIVYKEIWFGCFFSIFLEKHSLHTVHDDLKQANQRRESWAAKVYSGEIRRASHKPAPCTTEFRFNLGIGIRSVLFTRFCWYTVELSDLPALTLKNVLWKHFWRSTVLLLYANRVSGYSLKEVFLSQPKLYLQFFLKFNFSATCPYLKPRYFSLL